MSFEGASPELLCIFQKLSCLLFTLTAWKLQVRAGFLSEIWNSLVDVHICFLMAVLNTASCVPEPAPGPNCMHFQVFFLLLIALHLGEGKKKGTRQIIQGLTPTRRGNVPGSLSTYKQAFGGILIFMDAPCFPSLHYTHRPCRSISPHAASESNELQQGPEPPENTPSHLHSYLLSGQGFIWNLI